MVVLVVNENRVLALECKCQAPITVHLHGPVVFESSAQWVQSPSRSIHVGSRFGSIQLKELDREPAGMGRLNPCFASGREESFNTGVPEALDHVYSVARHYPAVKQLQ